MVQEEEGEEEVEVCVDKNKKGILVWRKSAGLGVLYFLYESKRKVLQRFVREKEYTQLFILLKCTSVISCNEKRLYV